MSPDREGGESGPDQEKWHPQMNPDNMVKRGKDVLVSNGTCGNELLRAVIDAQGHKIGTK